jgi:N-acetylglucosamine malate deacetylase 2
MNHTNAAAIYGSARRGVVAVVAHPDDEVLIAGGTLALAAAAGTPTAVVSLTSGERGPTAPESLRTGETLSDARRRELHAAALALGVPWARCLLHPDGALAAQDYDQVAAELARLLHACEPGVLLTFGADGLYGHPDHIATCAIVARTARRLDRDVAVFESVWPPDLMAEIVQTAQLRNLPTGLWGLDASAFGVARATAVDLDVRPVLRRKLRALRAHNTQFAADHLLAALPYDLAQRLLGTESWAAADGAPARALLATIATGAATAPAQAR